MLKSPKQTHYMMRHFIIGMRETGRGNRSLQWELLWKTHVVSGLDVQGYIDTAQSSLICGPSPHKQIDFDFILKPANLQL